MNNYQKAGVLVVRIAAAFMFLTGLIGLVMELLDTALPRQIAASLPMRAFLFPLLRDATTAGVGLFLWLFALPLGRLFGKGLG